MTLDENIERRGCQCGQRLALISRWRCRPTMSARNDGDPDTPSPASFCLFSRGERAGSDPGDLRPLHHARPLCDFGLDQLLHLFWGAATDSPPTAVSRRCLISGSLRISSVAALSVATTAGGVPLGARKPGTAEMTLWDAPRRDEIAFGLVMATGGRPHARIGGLAASDISVHDGQR